MVSLYTLVRFTLVGHKCAFSWIAVIPQELQNESSRTGKREVPYHPTTGTSAVQTRLIPYRRRRCLGGWLRGIHAAAKSLTVADGDGVCACSASGPDSRKCTN